MRSMASAQTFEPPHAKLLKLSTPIKVFEKQNMDY